MKTPGLSRIFHPLYVLLAGVTGGVIVVLLFVQNYPGPGDLVGEKFIHTPSYWVWIFLFFVLTSLVTIFFLPSWGMFVWLFRNHIASREKAHHRRTFTLLLLTASMVTMIVFLLFLLINSVQLGFQDDLPKVHGKRMTFMFSYIYLMLLPLILTMILIHTDAQDLSSQIETAGQDENRLFVLIQELLINRNLLQNALLIAGIIMSMVPIATAGLRAALIAVNPQNEQKLPITAVIIYGLVFTILLIFIYAPTHFAVLETSRKLRDHLSPMGSIATLKDTVEKRKLLDEMLQTNVGITQNLRAGIATLSPLVTSLIVSVLGINI
ncbi:MAG TPA: hypothetical protein VI451_18880 [Anaerolineales bacterium]|nr:hypothetical protein [Anaerolineales bacterium]